MGTHLLRFVPLSGEESGDYYAIDIGGTNMRLMYCKLGMDHGKIAEEKKVEVAIPTNKKSGSVQQLFDYVASSLKDFVIGTCGPQVSNVQAHMS